MPTDSTYSQDVHYWMYEPFEISSSPFFLNPLDEMALG